METRALKTGGSSSPNGGSRVSQNDNAIATSALTLHDPGTLGSSRSPSPSSRLTSRINSSISSKDDCDEEQEEMPADDRAIKHIKRRYEMTFKPIDGRLMIDIEIEGVKFFLMV